MQAPEKAKDEEVKRDSVDNILLFIQKAISDSGSGINSFQPVVSDACDRIHNLADSQFSLFVKSYYGISRLAQACLNRTADSNA